MEKIHENMHFLCFDVISNTRAQKHACFQVRFPFSAYFTPHYIIIRMVKVFTLAQRNLVAWGLPANGVTMPTGDKRAWTGSNFLTCSNKEVMLAALRQVAHTIDNSAFRQPVSLRASFFPRGLQPWSCMWRSLTTKRSERIF